MSPTSDALQSAYNDLQSYTLTHPGPEFIHQHLVDAWAAQYADEGSKPITLTFALIGLHLRTVHKLSGREVQLAHMRLAKQGGPWLTFTIPPREGLMTAVDVVSAPAGPQRDKAIHAWCDSVWAAWTPVHKQVASFAAQRWLGG